MKMSDISQKMRDIAKKLLEDGTVNLVIGWEKVREIDVISSGDPHPLKFDADVCREWLSDRPDLLVPLVDKIVALYQAFFAGGAIDANEASVAERLLAPAAPVSPPEPPPSRSPAHAD